MSLGPVGLERVLTRQLGRAVWTLLLLLLRHGAPLHVGHHPTLVSKALLTPAAVVGLWWVRGRGGVGQWGSVCRCIHSPLLLLFVSLLVGFLLFLHSLHLFFISGSVLCFWVSRRQKCANSALRTLSGLTRGWKAKSSSSSAETATFQEEHAFFKSFTFLFLLKWWHPLTNTICSFLPPIWPLPGSCLLSSSSSSRPSSTVGKEAGAFCWTARSSLRSAALLSCPSLTVLINFSSAELGSASSQQWHTIWQEGTFI